MNMDSFRSIRLRWKMLAAFGVLVALIMIIAQLAYGTIAMEAREREHLEHTHAVIEKQLKAREQVLTIGFDLRSYALLGQDLWIERVHNDVSALEQTLSDLHA